MLNVAPEVSKDLKELVIKIDLTKDFGSSKSGKSITIASTQGNVPVGNDGMRLGINLYIIKPVVATA